jgi:hypothetical protein
MEEMSSTINMALGPKRIIMGVLLFMMRITALCKLMRKGILVRLDRMD